MRAFTLYYLSFLALVDCHPVNWTFQRMLKKTVRYEPLYFAPSRN